VVHITHFGSNILDANSHAMHPFSPSRSSANRRLLSLVGALLPMAERHLSPNTAGCLASPEGYLACEHCAYGRDGVYVCADAEGFYADGRPRLCLRGCGGRGGHFL